jgi:hypothetical protein
MFQRSLTEIGSTHGNQIESDAAIKCVKAALDEGNHDL